MIISICNRKKQYGSTEAMLADCKWILHNCIIFNSTSSKLTSIAKSIVNVCKHEMQECLYLIFFLNHKNYFKVNFN